MFTMLKNLLAEEDGAVTVDWVVLTAAIVSMGLIVITSIEGGVGDAADNIAQDIDEKTS